MAGYDGRGARFNVVAVEGADLSFTVTAVDSAGDAVDLSAATITATVYNGAGTAIDTLTDAVSGAGSNIITLSFTDTEVDALVAPDSWALEVTRGGDDRVWLAGSFTVVAPSSARTSSTGTAVTATVDTNVVVTANVLTAAAVTGAGTGDLLSTNNLSDVANAATALSNLGGQPADADLTALAAANNSATLANVTAAYTTAEASKLAGIAAGAEVNTVDSVNAATGAVVLDADDIDDALTAHKFASAAELSKLSGIETGATADQTAAEVPVADTGALYVATNVETALAEVKTIADAAVTPGEAAAAYQPLAAVLTNTTASFTTADESKLDGIETAATADQTAGEIKTAYESNADTNAYDDAAVSKLAGIETGATADQSAADVSIVDTGALYTATNVEAALAEVKGIADSAAGGGITASGTPVANDFARFTDASTVAGRSYAEVRTDLGLVIGTDVQAHSAVLDATTASFTTADESKLDAIEALADVTDTTNVTAAGALMDSEVTNLADVKAFDPADYATAAQGATADTALQPTRVINAQTGTTYTLVLTDSGKTVTCSNAAAVTLTVPSNSSVAFPVGASIDIIGIGAGIVTVAAGAGVTVNATPSLVFRAQHSGASLLKLATDTWALVGDLATP